MSWTSSWMSTTSWSSRGEQACTTAVSRSAASAGGAGRVRAAKLRSHRRELLGEHVERGLVQLLAAVDAAHLGLAGSAAARRASDVAVVFCRPVLAHEDLQVVVKLGARGRFGAQATHTLSRGTDWWAARRPDSGGRAHLWAHRAAPAPSVPCSHAILVAHAAQRS